MKFPDKTLKFNFDHSPKAINSLITQSACVYLNLLPHVKRILTNICWEPNNNNKSSREHLACKKKWQIHNNANRDFI